MQYQSSGDLPDCVREHLPQHAQVLYLKAFNLAWDQYASANCRESETREALAHKLAWSAVTNIYEKDETNRNWKLKPNTQAHIL